MPYFGCATESASNTSHSPPGTRLSTSFSNFVTGPVKELSALGFFYHRLLEGSTDSGSHNDCRMRLQGMPLKVSPGSATAVRTKRTIAPN